MKTVLVQKKNSLLLKQRNFKITPMKFFQKAPLRFSTAILLASAISLSACASKPDRRGPPSDQQGRKGARQSSGTFMQPTAALFTAMDANGDKKVSSSELQAGTLAEWNRFGSRPSATYFAQWSIANLGSTDAMPTFMSFDRDFNGVVSEEEFSNQLDREFKRLDKNRDGMLERSELIVAFEAPRGEASRKGGQKGGGERGQGGPGGQGGGRPSR